MRVEKQTLTQAMHCCGGEDPTWDIATAEIAIHDGGGGEYVAINIREWAFDEPEQVDELADAIKAFMAMNVREGE